MQSFAVSWTDTAVGFPLSKKSLVCTEVQGDNSPSDVRVTGSINDLLPPLLFRRVRHHGWRIRFSNPPNVG
jgi:hypothetical protein